MTVPSRSPRDRTPQISDEQRLLGSYELQVRNLLGIQQHARPIVERLKGQRGLTQQAALVLDYMDICNLDSWITAVAALRRSLEAERK